MAIGLSYVRLGELKEWAGNPKFHAVEGLVAAFKRHGFRDIVVVSERDGLILAGHGRCRALRAMQRAGDDPPDGIQLDQDGEWLVPALIDTSMDETSAHAFALDSNLSVFAGGGLDFADMARAFDKKKLIKVLEELLEAGQAPVFADRAGLERLLEKPIDPRWDLADELPFQVGLAFGLHIEPRIQPGEIWALGKHRLMCGDATNPQDVQHLLGDQEIPLMIADAPYGVELDHTWRRLLSRKEAKSVRATRIQGDHNPNWQEVWKLWQPQVLYAFHAAQHAHLVRRGLIEAGYELRQQLIWAKQPVLSRSYYHWAHEPIWFAVRKGKDARWKGNRSQSTVWHHRSPLAGSGSTAPQDEPTAHPTQKPVALYEIPIRNHTNYGEKIADPFAGSGTIAIAAQRTGRHALMMEISPHCCEIAMQRWEKYTGEECQLVDQ